MAAKTTAPIDEAKTALERAQRARDQALAAMESFKDRILAGDDDVSAQDYSTAAGAVEHAELKVQAAALALRSAQEHARLRALEELKSEILGQTGSAEEMISDYQELVALMARVVTRLNARQRNVYRWSAQLARAGVPADTSTQLEPDPAHAGLARVPAGMGRPEAISVDGRTINSALTAAVFLGTAARQAALDAGLADLPLRDHPGLRDNPEQWIRSTY